MDFARSSRSAIALLILSAATGGGCGGGSGSSAPPGLPPQIVSFTATPAAMTPGQSSTLGWTVSGATTVTIDHGVGSVAGASVSVTPAATTTYTLTATNGSGSVTATVTVSVGPAPVVASFAASPSWVTTGQSSTLSWSVSGATSVSVEGLGSVTGSSLQVTPAADTIYVLTASNQFGSTQAQTPLAVFRPPTVWFAPIWNNSQTPPYGASDYFSLFSATAPWANAAAHVAVFKIYTHMLLQYDDATLRNMLADLKRRHIALAIEWEPLEPVAGCAHTEGVDVPDSGLHYAQRIRDLGGTLQYVAFDEPYQHASFLYSAPGACVWSAQQIAHIASQDVAKIRSVFPDIVVGDIEVVPDADSIDAWLGAYQQWVDAWLAETGTPLAFFHFDINWDNHWQPAVAALTRALAKRHIPVGYIYNGSGQTDAGWLTSAASHVTASEARAGFMPDQVIFQSWNPYPQHLLPETDSTAFTYLIDSYFRGRTAITLNVAASAAQGTLSDSNAAALALATVALNAVPLTGTGESLPYTAVGTVPTGTQYIVFGARVALENCSGVTPPAEFFLTDFTLDAGAAGQLRDDFSNQLQGWGVWGNAATAQVEGAQLHVQVLAGQNMALNSDSLPLAAAGAAYMFTVHAAIPPGSRGQGCAIVVFQDAAFNELARTVVDIVPSPVALGLAQTDASGNFSFALAPQPETYQLWAEYTGSAALRPSAAAVTVGQTAPLAVTTAALTDGIVGTAYAQPLAASGGRPPYLWVGAGLPPGISLAQDGTLAGTPTASGSFTVSASVVDDSEPARVIDASFPIVIH